MNFDLVKKNIAYEHFCKDVENGTVSHAYLVCSEDGELRKTFFTLAGMRLLCKTACGECETCTQILYGDYVEFLRLDGRDKITVRDISDLIDKIYVKPVVGDKKIVVIDNAELLSPQVQNKLLKTYEEPPLYLIMFLGASHESGLLATLRSRGKKLYLADISTEDIARELEDNGEDSVTAETAAAFSMGNFEKAELFCNEESYRDTYEKVFELFAGLKKSSQVPEYVYGGLFEKERIATTLDFLEIVLCDIMKLTVGGKIPLYTVNREYDLKQAAKEYTEQSAAESIVAINEARKQLASNINVYSVAGHLLMEILEAKYKWRKK